MLTPRDLITSFVALRVRDIAVVISSGVNIKTDDPLG
jgi:hypothetical protein